MSKYRISIGSGLSTNKYFYRGDHEPRGIPNLASPLLAPDVYQNCVGILYFTPFSLPAALVLTLQFPCGFWSMRD